MTISVASIALIAFGGVIVGALIGVVCMSALQIGRRDDG